MNASSRESQIKAFLLRAGYADAKREPIAGDASFRRYERITHLDRRAILMDAPPDKEDVRPFILVGEWLRQSGFSAPEIIAKDTDLGFLLLEDLGSASFTHILQKTPELEETLYRAAIDCLLALRRCSAPSTLKAYDTSLLLKEVSLFCEWYLPTVMESSSIDSARSNFLTLWGDIIAVMPNDDPVVVLRDYHADNLMWLPEREGIARVGQLDFQDAVAGHPAYDLVSLLEDARRDVSAAMAQTMMDYYISASGVDRDAFSVAYAVLGAQRNTKIIGIFMRLMLRDKKTSYQRFLPRVWQNLHHDLSHPTLAPIREWMHSYIPQAPIDMKEEA